MQHDRLKSMVRQILDSRDLPTAEAKEELEDEMFLDLPMVDDETVDLSPAVTESDPRAFQKHLKQRMLGKQRKTMLSGFLRKKNA